MEKTIKQIADELKIDKQKVYRYIKKNHIKEIHQKNGVNYYSEVAYTQIIKAFSSNEAHQEVHQKHINETLFDTLLKQSEMLKNELDMKNKQIAEMQKLLDQEQQLRMAEHQQVLLLEEQSISSKKHWWNFKKKDNE